MITLGLDTTGAFCTAALVSDTDVLSHKSEKIGRGHAERLAPMVDEIIKAAGVNPAEIDRLAVCTGPGSFTGLRVALSFARAFALPRQQPVLGLSALHVLAVQADPHKEKRVLSIMDVRRGELCFGLYDRHSEVTAPTTLPVDEALQAFTTMDYDLLAGDGTDVLGEDPAFPTVSGTALATLGAQLAPEDHPPTALYSRPPDAKLPGGITPP